MKNNKIIPTKSYNNAEKCKTEFYRENKYKSGIYRWNNLITNKSYIGSAKCLTKRFSFYYSSKKLKIKLKEGSSVIYSSILKHGYDNFSIDVLEYCDISLLINREQYYLDILQPEYNILKTAYSRLGAKHTERTKSLLKIASTGRKHSEEAKTKMRNIALLRKGKNTSFYNKTHTIETRIKISLKRCSLVKVEDKKLDKTYIFSGFMAAANHLNIGLSTLRRYRKLSSLIKGRYLVSTIN